MTGKGCEILGSQYDAEGNLRGWWRSETLATFQQKKQCFVAQYGNKIEPITERRVGYDIRNTRVQ